VSLELCDAHAHLAAPEFTHDLPAVLGRAEAAGVRGIVTTVDSGPVVGKKIPAPWKERREEMRTRSGGC
jgi:hypothetical protein